MGTLGSQSAHSAFDSRFVSRKTKKPRKSLTLRGFLNNSGGKGEIRTHGTPKGTLDFESSAFDHSATFPGLPTHQR